MTPEQFLDYLKSQVAVFGSQRALARHCGVGAAYMSDVLRGNRDPGPTILAALGFQRVITYERIAGNETTTQTTPR